VHIPDDTGVITNMVSNPFKHIEQPDED
jgi:hypothetical protein